jgi:hypothetical protein
LSRSREPPARSRTEQRRATPVLTVRPDRPYAPKKLGFHPACEQQGVARSSNGNILRAPTRTYLPHPPHAKTPWLGSLEKRPSLFGPFTLHAVCSVGLHAHGRAAAALRHRPCARLDGSSAARCQAGAVAHSRRPQRSDGSSFLASALAGACATMDWRSGWRRRCWFAIVLRPSRNGLGIASVSRQCIALSDCASERSESVRSPRMESGQLAQAPRG